MADDLCGPVLGGRAAAVARPRVGDDLMRLATSRPVLRYAQALARAKFRCLSDIVDGHELADGHTVLGGDMAG